MKNLLDELLDGVWCSLAVESENQFAREVFSRRLLFACVSSADSHAWSSNHFCITFKHLPRKHYESDYSAEMCDSPGLKPTILTSMKALCVIFGRGAGDRAALDAAAAAAGSPEAPRGGRQFIKRTRPRSEPWAAS